MPRYVVIIRKYRDFRVEVNAENARDARTRTVAKILDNDLVDVVPTETKLQDVLIHQLSASEVRG